MTAEEGVRAQLAESTVSSRKLRMAAELRSAWTAEGGCPHTSF